MMEPTFEKLLVRLAKAKVRFIVVGGIAVTLHGYVRLTEDVDLLLENSPENIKAFLDSLANYGEGFAKELSIEDFTAEEGAIRIVEVTEHCQIDAFTVMSGLYYNDLREDAEIFKTEQQQILFASKQKLIALKENTQRDKDQLDVLALKKLIQDPNALD